MGYAKTIQINFNFFHLDYPSTTKPDWTKNLDGRCILTPPHGIIFEILKDFSNNFHGGLVFDLRAHPFILLLL
jgi:hypothetical protein